MRKSPYALSQNRRCPAAERIAAEIAKHPAILNLRTPRLVSDIRGRFACSYGTAMNAISLARLSA